ncbi:AAA family ATPase [Haladaptatus sp. T7]|uniref:Cdc6/Cdc18 family protein n=1 Tax=Haladaptatus sp. T7 TaxID=2029368 RepID=UPI0021A251F8|nr:AAA family ATPase [Haladaptatus sp. T7]GKZ13309.1 ATP-binding protein [Haladaptatus sp. T7]
MDIGERIERRRATPPAANLVVEWSALSPVTHVSNPVGRGSTLERLLDALDPLFSGHLPPNVHLYGPPGAGKSALVSALFSQLATQLSPERGTILTTTRAVDEDGFDFVYIDARTASTAFRLYRTVLDSLTDDHVPERGVGTGVLQRKLATAVSRSNKVVVAVDHVGEDETLAAEEVTALFEDMSGSLSVLTVGRTRGREEHALEIPAYSTHELTDVVTERASRGLRQGILDHARVKTIAEWAEGDAHDALAALFGAVTLAVDADADRILDEYLEAAMDAVPRDGVPLGIVLSLPENRRRVLAELLELDTDARTSVESSAAAIATETDLSPGTVTRYLYELAEAGVLERITTRNGRRSGRQPSRLEPRFPTLVFRALHED